MDLKIIPLNRAQRAIPQSVSEDELLTQILGEKYRHYRELWKETSRQNGIEVPFPVHLDLELQDFCNQSCIMCPRNDEHHTNLPYPLASMKIALLDELKKVIEEGASQGLLSVNFGAFSEPLIHKGLWELIKYSHDVGIVDSRVITNGLLLDRYEEEIFSSGLRNLFVSLDAFTTETYTRIRGKGFGKVVQNLLRIIEKRNKLNSGLPVIRVSFVEMETNRHEKEHFLEFWSGKVDFVDIQTWSDFRRPANSKELEARKKFSCRSPWQRMSILANGQILPCCDFNGRTLLIGNIREVSLKEAWHSQKMQEIREGISDETSPVCNSCQRGFGV